MSMHIYHDGPMRDGKDRLLRALGAHIRHWRKQRHLSQERLAERAGITAKYLSELETGKRNVSIVLAIKIMQALSLTEPEFFQFLPRPRAQSQHSLLLDEFKGALDQGTVRVALLAIRNDEQ